MFSSSEKCDLTVLFKSWLWSYHSCLLLSSSLSNMHTQIFTDHIISLFIIFFLSLWFIKIFYWTSFFREKWENGNIYWKGLVPLKQTGAALAVLLAGTWTPAKKPTDVSVGGNVMIERAVDLLCLQEEISHFSGIPYWAGALKFNKQCTFLYFNLHKVIVIWNFGLKPTRSFKVPINSQRMLLIWCNMYNTAKVNLLSKCSTFQSHTVIEDVVFDAWYQNFKIKCVGCLVSSCCLSTCFVLSSMEKSASYSSISSRLRTVFKISNLGQILHTFLALISQRLSIL